MSYYNLTGTQNFYGQRDVKTYYNVPAHKVWKGLEYMAENFNLPAVFVYKKIHGVRLEDCPFVGTYSRKYKNFRTSDGRVTNTFSF